MSSDPILVVFLPLMLHLWHRPSLTATISYIADPSERAIDLCPEGQEQVCIVVDYKQATSTNTPSVSTGLQALNILQHHYVEREYKAAEAAAGS